jgi:hypothetical protein
MDAKIISASGLNIATHHLKVPSLPKVKRKFEAHQ